MRQPPSGFFTKKNTALVTLRITVTSLKKKKTVTSLPKYKPFLKN
jgi:hypothetical protein